LNISKKGWRNCSGALIDTEIIYSMQKQPLDTAYLVVAYINLIGMLPECEAFVVTKGLQRYQTSGF
jgi:hypothetical protein